MTAKKLIAAVLAAAALGSVAAHAGYYTPIYVPTCVPGYWAMGPIGPFWVPPVCR